MSNERTRAVLALLTTMFFWGTSAVLMRTTALTLAAENALALRMVVLVPLFALGLAATGQWRIARAHWPRLAVTAFGGMLGASWFTTQGFEHLAAGVGTVVQMVEPLFIALLAAVVLREAPSRWLWLGLGVSILGGIVLFWPDLTAAAAAPVHPWGVTALIVASLCFAVYTIAAKPLLAHYSGFAVTAWSMILAAPFVFFLTTRPPAELLFETPAGTWGEIVYLAIFNSIVGNVCWTYGARHLPGAVAGSFLYLMPVFAVAAGFVWLGEPITPHLVAGGVILLAGVALAQSRSGHA